MLQRAGLGTLLIDLSSQEGDVAYEARFDIHLLAERLTAATQWLRVQPLTKALGIGYFGASTGAAAALQASVALGPVIRAVVSRGGRNDVVIELNQRAYERLRSDKQLVIVPGAMYLFEGAGALPEVARLAAEWFSRYLPLQAAPDR